MKTLKDITDKIPKEARDKMVKYAKKAFDLGWTAHSNKLIVEKLTNHAATLPKGRTKTRMDEIATFILAHDEMCYEDFVDYFDNVKGWYPDPELYAELKKAVIDNPTILKLYNRVNKYED